MPGAVIESAKQRCGKLRDKHESFTPDFFVVIKYVLVKDLQVIYTRGLMQTNTFPTHIRRSPLFLMTKRENPGKGRGSDPHTYTHTHTHTHTHIHM